MQFGKIIAVFISSAQTFGDLTDATAAQVTSKRQNILKSIIELSDTALLKNRIRDPEKGWSPIEGVAQILMSAKNLGGASLFLQMIVFVSEND